MVITNHSSLKHLGNIDMKVAPVNKTNQISKTQEQSENSEDTLELTFKVNVQVLEANNTRATINTAISFIQTQEALLYKMNPWLSRMKELANHAMSSSTSTPDRDRYQSEFLSLAIRISQITGKEFNGIKLFAPSSLNNSPESEMSDSQVNSSASNFEGVQRSKLSTPSEAAQAFRQVSTTIQNVESILFALKRIRAKLELLSDHLRKVVDKQYATAKTKGDAK